MRDAAARQFLRLYVPHRSPVRQKKNKKIGSFRQLVLSGRLRPGIMRRRQFRLRVARGGRSRPRSVASRSRIVRDPSTMRRVLRLALALSVLVALSAPGAVRAQSRDEDPGVPQVTLEFEDDYEDTRATGHAAYDEMDAAAMVRAPVFERIDPRDAVDDPDAPPRGARPALEEDADDVNLVPELPRLRRQTQGGDASRYGSTGTGTEPEEERMETGYVEPEPAEPRAVEPEVVEPDPEAVDESEAVEPEAVEPEVVEPEAVEPAEPEPEAIPPDPQPAAAPREAETGSEEKSSDDARQAALARRAAEEAEVKAAEAAEKSRRDTGAPVEKEAPATIFDYYKPPVLEPVYVGGYYKRANPWDKGKRSDDGAL